MQTSYPSLLPKQISWRFAQVKPLRYNFPCSLLQQSIFSKPYYLAMLSSPLSSWSHHFTPDSVFVSSLPSDIIQDNLTSTRIFPQSTQTSHFLVFFLSPMIFCSPLLHLSYLSLMLLTFIIIQSAPPPILLLQPSHIPARLLDYLYTMILRPR